MLFWFSSRCRNFGTSGSEKRYCDCTTPLFLAAPLTGAAGTLSSTRLSVNSPNHPRRSRNGFPRKVASTSFFLFFSISAGSCDGLTRTMLLVLSLLADAGRNVGTTAPCNTDVGDVGVAELEELVDKPGTTIGT